MGSVGHMLYMMQQIAPGPFRMAHYAMATGVMALTKWATGSVSGLLWNAVGHQYVSFFGWVLIFSIPPVILAWLAPFPHDHEEQREFDGQAAPAGGH
jgi:PAT family beta-lactamase induction signal transducer AmpG